MFTLESMGLMDVKENKFGPKTFPTSDGFLTQFYIQLVPNSGPYSCLTWSIIWTDYHRNYTH